jgi:hypothetical protein
MSEASWLADPTGAHELRYWNGSSWTEHVSDRGTTGQDPLTTELPPPPDAGFVSGTVVEVDGGRTITV